MAAYLLWAIVGFVLIIAELLTGTFYLLVLGVAALVGAVAAYAGAPVWIQALIAAAAALAGIYGVHKWWLSHPKSADSDNNLDLGQTVVLDSWVNEAAGLTRVRYRGTLWDARVSGSAAPTDVLVIRGQAQGVLQVSA